VVEIGAGLNWLGKERRTAVHHLSSSPVRMETFFYLRRNQKIK
jgi:hypothetical protein